VRDCTSCGHRFAEIAGDEAHVAANYDDAYFNGGGAGYSDYTAEATLLIARGRMYAEKIAPHAENGEMLDVGAAAGFILKGFAEKGWRGDGIEPNASMAEHGREQLGLDIRQGSFETLATDKVYDLISMIQVAAHFYDPATAFQSAHKLLKPSGLLLIESWDRRSFSARLLGKHWHEYSPPTVLQWFSKQGLTDYLLDLGFDRIDGGRPSKKISGGHVRSLLGYRLGESFLLKLIPDKVNFPYPSEDLFWALYRKR
jgi:SAM-dependent methyltransferase